MFNWFKKKKKLYIDIDTSYPENPEVLDNIEEKVFKLNKLESWRYYKFYREHKNCVYEKFGSIGGGITIHITPTGLGNVIHLECQACGKKLSITDSDSW